ncbi:MAG: hypothetical protein L0Z54_00015 [Thermoplasmata archaeon]|nr:hypothetical protein [Thermoplasmata archaeon]
MHAVAIATRNFTLYHDLIDALRARDLHFTSLDIGEEVPSSVGVVITGDGDDVHFPCPVVVVPAYPRATRRPIAEVEAAIDAAIGHLRGGIDRIVIGIDPGKCPGVAVLADGFPINTYHLTDMKDLRGIVRNVRRYHGGAMVARVGNGSPAERDAAIGVLLREGLEVQVVDESGSTREARDPHVNAAIRIAKYCPVIEALRPDDRSPRPEKR